MTPAAKTAAGLMGLMATGLAYALVEARWFVLRHAVVPVLAPTATPLKVLHLSDLHLTAGQSGKAAWVAALARLEPDLVVITGDLLGATDGLPGLETALGALLDRPGAFVFGSNDYFSAKPKNPLAYLWRRSDQDRRRRPDLPVGALRHQLMDHGWCDLNNARATVSVPSGLVELVGLGDPHLQMDRLPAVSASPDGAGAKSAVIKLGLVHAPYRSAIRALVQDGARLVLAGHTHGGQVAVPGYGALVSNCDLPPRFAKGLHRLAPAPAFRGEPDSPSPSALSGTGSLGWSGTGASVTLDPMVCPMPAHTYLHVSAGLGTSPYAPIRFACRPEASLLTLVPAL